MNPEVVNQLVRPWTAFVFGVTFIYGFIMGLIGPEVFVSVASVVFTWYFKTRDEAKEKS